MWKKDAGAAEASGDPYPDWTSYLADLERVKAIVSSEEVKDYCMKALEANWTAFNQKSERALELKKLARLTIDFTQVMKVVSWSMLRFHAAIPCC